MYLTAESAKLFSKCLLFCSLNGVYGLQLLHIFINAFYYLTG